MQQQFVVSWFRCYWTKIDESCVNRMSKLSWQLTVGIYVSLRSLWWLTGENSAILKISSPNRTEKISIKFIYPFTSSLFPMFNIIDRMHQVCGESAILLIGGFPNIFDVPRNLQIPEVFRSFDFSQFSDKLLRE